MEPVRRRLCPGPQRLPALADPSRPRSKEPPTGFSPWPITDGETALGGLVCRGASTAGGALGAAGRGGVRLRAEGQKIETTAEEGMAG